MVTLTAISVALVIAGTYVESLPRTHVFFSYIFRCHVLAIIALHYRLSIEANSVYPEQTVPIGAV